MPVSIETQVPPSLEFANLQPRGPVHPSPQDWADQVLYFLLPDRFSDGLEHQRPMYDRANPDPCRTPDSRSWMEAGIVFQGGTLNGIRSELPYLKALGVTALWVGPIWKQRADDPRSYHGY